MNYIEEYITKLLEEQEETFGNAFAGSYFGSGR